VSANGWGVDIFFSLSYRILLLRPDSQTHGAESNVYYLVARDTTI